MKGVMFYFSGTGNSKYIAKRFAAIMKEKYHQEYEVYSIEETMEFERLIKENNIIGICYPIYGSSVPKIMRQFVEKYKKLLDHKRLIIFLYPVNVFWRRGESSY